MGYHLLLTICIFSAVCSIRAERQHTIFVLVGGTGDLAARYLWDGLFNLYYSQHGVGIPEKSAAVNHTFDFLAAGRTAQDEGNIILNSVLKSSVKCPEELSQDTFCAKRVTEFINKVVYMSLKEEEDFAILCTEIQDLLSRTTPNTKQELILYLAIAPSAYETVAERFHRKCLRKVRDLGASLKVALEKPFGLDKRSAEVMSEKILSLFKEKELFRVDHYLGKPVVKSILPFRYLNPHIEKRLNKNHVDRVEIFLKETVDVEDRLTLYNTMGILRDVHQNHLTQLLALIAMDLPSSLSDEAQVQENKGRLLRQVASVRRHNSLFGQYRQYASYEELKGSSAKDVGTSTLNSTLGAVSVPTFAACMLNINSPRWHGVPFLLVSGKQLDVRESYIRIVFKDNRVCVSQCSHKKSSTLDSPVISQVVFHIDNMSERNIGVPSVLVSKDFTYPECSSGLQESEDPGLFRSQDVYGDRQESFHVCVVVKHTQAYQSLFKDLVESNSANFVNTQHLLLSWQIWDYLVNAPKKVVTYNKADPETRLNFIIKDNGLVFVKDDEDQPAEPVPEDEKVITRSEVMHDYVQTPASFLGHKLVTSHADHLAFLLARDIDRAAEREIESKGSFHLALAGGSSLLKVFKMLAQSFANLHWHAIHVWQVDERCVPHQDEHSNFQTLDRELLRFVDIPYSNIHPMPVDTGGSLCDPELGGAHAYSDTIQHIVPNSQFDMVVVGVGTDGHVASLFPGSPDLRVDSSTHVVVTNNGPSNTQHRMTLTLPIINKSRRVAVFVTGVHKQQIVNQLEAVGHGKGSVDMYPILGVNPVNGTVTWYMDYKAYAGGYQERPAM
ncbi:hexose-6-phosphate dehydrogenase (glucose 1-dehydrogenase) [Plakobranchus ocellatus]|uniref:Hexose-6-phosphate dehydrogenase (Glucose 1-dehydrogenase) n=1 Tax=Plakobranchus ocellatus TaxID=259542 RepID=A0AAV4C603_9GAST|nr:hexose-6-phosphate dehydrogenase (glucose 1-dehydrogenase) [Plakobranchus ocellatus]